MQEYLTYYQAQGLKIIPIVPNDKTPLIKGGFKSADNTDDFISAHFKGRGEGVGLVPQSLGIVVIDIDVSDKKDGFKTLQVEGIELPNTITVTTPRGGKHFYYINDTTESVKSKIDLFPGVDIRAEACYIIAPPTKRSDTPNGGYTWDNLDMTKPFLEQLKPISSVPIKLFEALTSKSKKPKKSTAHITNIGKSVTLEEGARNDTLYKRACSLQKKGYSDDRIREEVYQFNQTHCVPPLDAEEVDTLVNSALKHPKGFSFNPKTDDDPRYYLMGKVTEDTAYYYDEYGKQKLVKIRVAESIKKHVPLFVLGGQFYVCGHKTKLYHFDDTEKYITALVAMHLIDADTDDSKIKSIVNLLRKDIDIVKEQSELNNFNTALVPFKNGLFDPMANSITPVRPEHFLTYQLPHTLDLTLKEPTVFLEWLGSIFSDDSDSLLMLFDYLAYSLTRMIDNQVFMILHGAGGLGKSVLLRLLVDIVGEKNHQSIALQNLGDRFNRIKLKDTLLVTYGDLTSEALAYTDTIKAITGGDAINGEHKGQPVITFSVYCKLLFSANQIPSQYDEHSNAFYRRLLVTEFTKRGKEIPNLEKRLNRELPQIIAYLCKWLADLNQRGYKVHNSKNSQRIVHQLSRDADSVRAFAEDCLIISKDEQTYRTDIYDAYTAYCYSEGYRNPLSQRKFYPRLEGLGFKQWKSNGIRVFNVVINRTIAHPFIEK